jgi:uncharacterized protein YbjQ (UPF0145 family)
MNHDLATTAPTLDGYQIVQNLGIVRGISVRSRSVFGTIGAKIETMFGGNIALLTTLCEKTRREAYDIMMEHAEHMGADAVVAMRYDATELMPGVSEVLCYGTAVVIQEQPAAGA